ncbi:hypothetical protein IIA16_03685 [bacterium]|nr:hypothetical protein [bacterium]
MDLKIRDSHGVVHDLVVDTVAGTVSVDGDDPVPFAIHRREHGIVALQIAGRRLPVEWKRDGIRISLLLDGTTHTMERETTYAFLQRREGGPVGGAREIRSPIPGVISSVQVAKGDTVTVGQVVCILQAMKMENEIASPIAGVVTKVNVVEGESVGNDVVLAVVKA